MRALLRGAAARGAACVRGPARPLADDARVRRRPRGAGPPADDRRALRELERGEAGGRARPAPVRNPGRAARLLRELGGELGRTPTARDLDERRGSLPSKSLYWHTFGSLAAALREAGFDVPAREQRLERAVAQGAVLARRLGRLPRFADWADARRADPGLPTEWQVYRLLESGRGAWSTFQFLVRERLRAEGATVTADGRRREGRRPRRSPDSLQRLGGGDDRGEPLEARRALVRRADGRQGLLLVGAVGREARRRARRARPRA